MQEIELEHKVHIIGIGGIGVSAIARMFLLRGSKVSGSDLSRSRVTDELEEKGARIFYTQEAENVPGDVDLVVHTIAVPDSNPELKRARELGTAVLTYPEVLGMLSRSHRTVAVAGTHGKTTTTAMTAEALIASGLAPTVVVGSLLKKHQSNFIPGESDIFVVEACEYRESFRHLNPTILAITNIEAEHLDYYKDLDNVIAAFNRLAKKVPSDGFIIADTSSDNVTRALEGVEANIIDYAQVLGEVNLSVPGEHNRQNGAVALSVARVLEADGEKARQALKEFSGTWRRFEKKGESSEGALVYDDYAHHPTEIRAALSAAREAFPGKKIIAVFQPHLFSRTKLLLREFAQAFSDADKVFVLPIYKARETDDGSVSSEMLVEKMRDHHDGVNYSETFVETKELLRKHLDTNTVVVTLGAGDVYKVGEQLVQHD